MTQALGVGMGVSKSSAASVERPPVFVGIERSVSLPPISSYTHGQQRPHTAVELTTAPLCRFHIMGGGTRILLPVWLIGLI
jgi:hypothetical protein